MNEQTKKINKHIKKTSKNLKKIQKNTRTIREYYLNKKIQEANIDGNNKHYEYLFNLILMEHQQ